MWEDEQRLNHHLKVNWVGEYGVKAELYLLSSTLTWYFSTKEYILRTLGIFSTFKVLWFHDFLPVSAIYIDCAMYLIYKQKTLS